MPETETERVGLSEAVDAAKTVFGWQHLARYSGQTSEWLDLTLTAMIEAASRHILAARHAALLAELTASREALARVQAAIDREESGGCHYRHQQGETDECNACTATRIGIARSADTERTEA